MEMIDGTEELFHPTTIHQPPPPLNFPITPPLSIAAVFRGVHHSQPLVKSPKHLRTRIKNKI